MLLRKILLLLVFSTGFLVAKADEGMWLPQLLKKLNEGRMISLGMKISAEDIYSINKGSLKDAIVSFGGFCTGEIISDQGLVLTNHHCGFGAVQSHSSLDHNYIQDGFWAKQKSEELPNKGLFVTFIVRIEDVTAQAMKGVTDKLSENERQALIQKNLDAAKNAFPISATQKSFTRGFFEGNQYYLFVTETYNDVRLVGAPPSSIGNFGKDTDNWSWPRHTGDFAMFRIYADKNNNPADYSPENVPFKPRKSLSISLDGVAENDFTMVFGFPGRTSEYLHSAAVEHIRTVSDPAKINIREHAMKVMDDFMRKDPAVKIQYASKYASLSNYWKKWKGEVMGLTRTNAVEKKKNYEADFQKRVLASANWKTQYSDLLQELESANQDIAPLSLGRDYFNEIMSRFELYTISMQLQALKSAYVNNGEKGYAERLKIFESSMHKFFKDYSVDVDKGIFESLIKLYVEKQPKEFVSPLLLQWLDGSDDSYAALTNKLYSQRNLYNYDYMQALIKKPVSEVMTAIDGFDAIGLFNDMRNTYVAKIATPIKDKQDRLDKLQRIYMQAQLEVMKEKTFYPDANSTMRVTFGQVKGYTGRDAIQYDYITTLDGVMEKYIPGDYEFDLPAKLIQLYEAKDYGRYGKDGVMTVCFIASNHTTGGNSGSPALDAHGNLIGLNFDRTWEGTMSDINYDPSICRNIMVDIRYVLFIVDKFAGATNLIDEMKIVYPKTKKK